ncbi:MAG: ribose 5-phosphate isomerase B [Myxococcales bacterium]|jgi:ribose 5-phosphate isomerase B|nr:ribose 5-phosphate isomerase B [Myxococcales bacterium]
MRIALGSDHAGLCLKREIAAQLTSLGHEPLDFGTQGTASVDYPDFAEKVARAIQSGDCAKGVLVCGTGVGMCIAANKFRGIRAALCTCELEARMTRQHNDANILCLGERVIGVELARAIAEAFFATAFAGGRHQVRLDKIAAIERGEAQR